MRNSIITRQSGHAAILFAMIVPILFGVFTLGSDGARAVQSKARLNEALEVASLAVAAQDSSDKDIRISTAMTYIKYYLPQVDISANDVDVEKVTCDKDSTSCNYDAEKSRYFEYRISAKVNQSAWFPGNDAIVGFGKSYDVGSSSVARRYQSEAIDIVYVADFSSSMLDTLPTATGDDIGLAKYEILINIIKEVNDEIKQFNRRIALNSDAQSMVGFTAFNDYVHGTNKDVYPPETCNFDNWVYKGPHKSSGVKYDITSSEDHVFYPEPSTCETGEGDAGTADGIFHDIALTDQFGADSSLFENEIDTFEPASKTSSTQGIIQGSRIIDKGDNPRKLLIILSDGEDFPDSRKEDSVALVNAGLCDNIREHLDSHPTSDGHSVKSRIALIGFDFNPIKTPALITCVGGSESGNVFQANSGSDLKTAILSLISEEIGHLAN